MQGEGRHAPVHRCPAPRLTLHPCDKSNPQEPQVLSVLNVLPAVLNPESIPLPLGLPFDMAKTAPSSGLLPGNLSAPWGHPLVSSATLHTALSTSTEHQKMGTHCPAGCFLLCIGVCSPTSDFRGPRVFQEGCTQGVAWVAWDSS